MKDKYETSHNAIIDSQANFSVIWLNKKAELRAIDLDYRGSSTRSCLVSEKVYKLVI
ncbi:MAG: hypothetical protein IPL25_14865 [Saprospiraceae bacterium]|nr:hypothetical protein [Candidatus Vicinibacter affinis]